MYFEFLKYKKSTSLLFFRRLKIEFKNKFFDGNEEKALAQLAYESYSENYELTENAGALKKILDTMDRKTANKYCYFLREEIRKGPKKFDKAYKFAQILQKNKYKKLKFLLTF